MPGAQVPCCLSVVRQLALAIAIAIAIAFSGFTTGSTQPVVAPVSALGQFWAGGARGHRSASTHQ